MLIVDPIALKNFSSSHRVWQGIPGIAHTKGGKTFVSFYSGKTEEIYGNFAVVIQSENGVDFSEPIVAAYKEGNFRCFDPVLWIDPLERLWFIWNVMPGEEVFASICECPDAEQLLWTEPFYIGRGIMMNKPTVLSTGEWLFPIAIWKTDIYNNFRKIALTTKDIAGSYVYKTADNGKTFIRLGYADLPNRSFDEHMVLEMNNGVLRMLVRLQKGIGESYSYDRGRHWTVGRDSGLDGPSSRFFIKKLRSGKVLMINHYHFNGRNNLTALLSEDDGVTFPYSLLLDERNWVSYPDAVECEDGSIYIVYDRERGAFLASLEEAYAEAREILTARITENDILNGSLCTKSSFLKRVVCKLDRLAEGEADPFADISISSRVRAEEMIDSGDPNLLGKLFDKYAPNFNNTNRSDAQKLNVLFDTFLENDDLDTETLTQIIDVLRQVSIIQKERTIVSEALEYIETHLTETVSVVQIAETLSCNIHYLLHVLKYTTNITVEEYQNELRLTRIKQLLLNTDDSIDTIAHKTGFANSANLSEIFLESEKLSPDQYRTLHQKG